MTNTLDAHVKAYQKTANAIAKAAGYGRATHIVRGAADAVLEHVAPGYVKDTTGEYVPNAYRKNFGWKNTHYVNSKTVVQIKE